MKTVNIFETHLQKTSVMKKLNFMDNFQIVAKFYNSLYNQITKTYFQIFFKYFNCYTTRIHIQRTHPYIYAHI